MSFLRHEEWCQAEQWALSKYVSSAWIAVPLNVTLKPKTILPKCVEVLHFFFFLCLI